MGKIILATEKDLEAVAELAARKVLAEPAPNWMTFAEVCEYVGYSRSTVQKWIDNRQFPVSRKCGHPRFNRLDVDEWMKGDL